MARVIWAWAIDSDTFLTTAQIPGILNIEKDKESRNSELRTEWKLQVSIFKNIQNILISIPQVTYLRLL